MMEISNEPGIYIHDIYMTVKQQCFYYLLWQEEPIEPNESLLTHKQKYIRSIWPLFFFVTCLLSHSHQPAFDFFCSRPAPQWPINLPAPNWAYLSDLWGNQSTWDKPMQFKEELANCSQTAPKGRIKPESQELWGSRNCYFNLWYSDQWFVVQLQNFEVLPTLECWSLCLS